MPTIFPTPTTALPVAAARCGGGRGAGGARMPRSGRTRGRGGAVRRRSNLLVLLGVAFFLVGGLLVYLLTDDDDGGGGGGDAQDVTVVVATEDVSAGTLADDLIESGRLRTVEIPAAQVIPGAVQSVNQMAGATFI